MSRFAPLWKACQRVFSPASGVHNIAGPTVESSDRRFLDWIGHLPTASGVHVTPETAQQVSAVYACVDRISGGIASLPCQIYRRDGETRSRVEDHPLWYLLNEQPTARWTAASAWARAAQYTMLRGDAFAIIKRDAGARVKEIVPVPWEAVTVDPLTLDYDSRNIYLVNDSYRGRAYDQDDILHFPGYGFDGYRSMSVLSWGARQATGNAIAMDQYSGRFFADGAHPSIVLQTAGKMNQAQIDQLKTAFVEKYSGLANAHKSPLVLTEGLTANAISLNAQDMQLLDARKFQVIDIARAFGIPPHLIGETSGSTSWGSGIESMGRAYVMFTLQTHLRRIEQELNRKLFRNAGTFVEFDRSALLEGDLVAQATFFRAALGGPGSGPGWMSPNEVRARKNLEPKTGSDKLFVPTPGATPVKSPKGPNEEEGKS